MDEKRIAAIFKAFCDENRIRIIKLLSLFLMQVKNVLASC